jgi:cell wall-associated NlpC family hydrolase
MFSGLCRFLVTALLAVCCAVAGACATTGAVPKPFPTPSVRGPEPGRSPVEGVAGGEASSLVRTALEFQGVPYRNGGADPSGFDCSGFTQYVFAQYQVGLPREVRRQFETGVAIAPSEVVPGDLLFFTTTDPGASHVGIAAGGDLFVHAPSSNGVVRLERWSSSYWSARFVGARRITLP